MTHYTLTPYLQSISEPLDEAAKWLMILDTKPKKRHFHWHNCQVDGKQFSVEVNTNATQTTVSKWFGEVHLVATRFEQREKGFCVWFRLAKEWEGKAEMTRNKWAKRIADVIRDVEWFSDPHKGWVQALGHLEDMRLEALEPLEAKVYKWVIEAEIPITSDNVAAAFKIKQNHAGTVLKALMDYGLICRREQRDSNGKRFIYAPLEPK